MALAWKDFILDVQIASTAGGGPSGAIAEIYLNGGWDVVFTNQIEPVINTLKEVSFWIPGGFELLPGSGAIAASTLPSVEFNFRTSIDPRYIDLITSYPTFTKKLRQQYGLKVYSYIGSIPKDVTLNAANDVNKFLPEFWRQMHPYVGTVVVVDAWADITDAQFRILRCIESITNTKESAVEGTPRSAGESNDNPRVGHWYLFNNLLTGTPYLTTEQSANLPGQTVEWFRGYPSGRDARIAVLQSYAKMPKVCSTTDLITFE